ncbi:MAG: type II CRISPR RNA-guided endonuclease Cas9 [Spirosomataceae bacterium]
MATILGLDLGVTSVGWAFVETTNDQSGQVLDVGSRIFAPGVNVSPLGKEESKNADRRNARQVRRQIFRKRQRQDLLLEVFQTLGWLPLDPTYLQEIWSENPYQLRKKALDEPLTQQQLARVLYHLGKRRGFKSSRKSGGDEEGTLYKGDAKIGKAGITELQQAMAETNSRTLGEYFASLNTAEIRIRNRYVLRSQYQEEFELIWASQRRFWPDIQKPIHYEGLIRKVCGKAQQTTWLARDFYEFLKNFVIYFQRPLKSQKSLVGKCQLEPSCRRAPLSALHVQEFRIWDKLYSLRLTGADRTDAPLSPTEMQQAYEVLATAKEKTVGDLLKSLHLSDYQVNYKADDKFKGNRTAHALQQVFGKARWATLSPQEQAATWKIVYDADDNDFLVQYGINKWALSAEAADKLRKVNFEKDYASLSTKAIQQLLPLMRTGRYPYDLACRELGYHHSQSSLKAGYADQLSEPALRRNPIVQQGLNELKKVVNTLIQSYGIKPDVIRVELARELKMPKEKREKLLADNKARENEHIRIHNILKQEFKEFVNRDPEPDDIVKYKLYEECKHICPYTGQSISASSLFSGAFEVEHIVPYSRSLDDSFQNKTLCEKQFNNKKGNRLPHEMMVQGLISVAEYEAMIERVKTFRDRNNRLPLGKLRRFLRQSVPQNFANEQLNDTAYFSREAKLYLSQICSKVQVSNGQSTAKLRHLWGLNRILNPQGLNLKSRDDHRHHAVDALVVACTSPQTLQRLSLYKQKGQTLSQRDFPLPWEGFRNQARDKVNSVLVSHRHKSRVRGKLHDETFYGAVRNFDGQRRTDDKGQPVFSVRKDLRSLSPAMILKIADPKVRELVLDRLKAQGVDVSQKFSIPPGAFAEPLYMPTKNGVKIEIKKVRVHDVGSNKIEIRPGVFVDPGSNHHIVIFQKPNGKRDGTVVSFFEATQRRKQGRPVVNTDCGEGNTFVMSLSINEMVLIDTEQFKTAQLDWNQVSQQELSQHLYRVQKMDVNKNIIFRHHLSTSTEDKEHAGYLKKTAGSFAGIKVKINAIGEIERA